MSNMEKSPAYELSEKADGDNLQLISGSVASSPNPSVIAEALTRTERKQAQRATCQQQCCSFLFGTISVLALCASVVAIVLVVAFPNATNPVVQELLVLKDELTAQQTSTPSPSVSDSIGISITNLSQEIKMIRESLDSSLNSLGQSISQSVSESVGTTIANLSQEIKAIGRTLDSSLNSVGLSIEASLNSMGSLLERLVKVQESQNETCQEQPYPPIGSAANPAMSCRDIPADSPSGDYWIQTNATNCPIRVYCDLDGSACSCRCDTQEGGWMRAANFDMTDPNQNCPDGFLQVNSSDPPLRLCGRPSDGCSSVFFPVYGIQYSRVCGRVKGYRYATADAFNQNLAAGLDSTYIDGVSITYGSPRTHIWSFAASVRSTNSPVGCPCDTMDYQGNLPPYIGHDYFCESGTGINALRLDTTTPLWDGQGCVSTSTCCVFNSPPYFCQTLSVPTAEDIEVRICGNQDITDEDTPVEVIELYIY